MKNDKGITLISLVITIIVILILTSISYYTGVNNVKESRDSAVKIELQLVQQAVIQKYTKSKLIGDFSILPGKPYDEGDFTELNSIIGKIAEKTKVTIKLKDINASNYFLLDTTSLGMLGITNTKDEYIVNYVTGEVINKTRMVTSKSKEPLYIYGINNE